MISAGPTTCIDDIIGIKELWELSIGDPRICIAVLDGPIDRSHPCLAGADLTSKDAFAPENSKCGAACRHGTHVASIIFAQHECDRPLKGIAPLCRGLSISIYSDGPNDSIEASSQIDLARAILQAVQAGAHVINISGGEFSASGTAHPILADAVRKCAEAGVLVVAAAGNDGCNCLHVPGSLPSVLAVGAMNSQGKPMEFSNWGDLYQFQGILAPAENIIGAAPKGAIASYSGTSYGTPIISGVAALLLCLQIQRGQSPNTQAVRSALIGSADGCEVDPIANCRRLLAGRLNVKRALSQIIQRGTMMADSTERTESVTSPESVTAVTEESVSYASGAGIQAAGSEPMESHTIEDTQPPPVEQAAPVNAAETAASAAVMPSDSKSSDCSCGKQACSCGGASSIQLVYALGQLGFDFGSEARRDSLAQHMDGNPLDPHHLLAYLEENPWDAEAILWTLNLDATPIYAIQPLGVFASEGYQRLRQFLKEQLTEGVERISLPGVIVGKARLLTGQVVPAVRPDLRCMYSWTTSALVEAVSGKASDEAAKEERGKANTRRRREIANFLERIYHELRNLGLISQERAINYAATNAFNVNHIFESALKAKLELDLIEVERSPICRPDSDCWDVKLLFFDPENVLRSRKSYRFTVDVSDVCPVTVGEVRSWSVR
jgi:cyanobactin maturation PatA/PatG family protease